MNSLSPSPLVPPYENSYLKFEISNLKSTKGKGRSFGAFLWKAENKQRSNTARNFQITSGSHWIVASACLLVLITGFAFGKDDIIKPDETVVFYPTAASLETNQFGHILWRLPVHVNLCKIKNRSVALKLFGPLMGLDKDEMTAEELLMYKERMRLLLVDNHRGRMIPLELPGLRTNLPSTHSNGRAEGEFIISTKSIAQTRSFVPFSIPTNFTQGRTMEGKVMLVAPNSTIVISDLDDTLRIAHVLNKKEMLKNTFCRPFKPVDGMSVLYQKWHREQNTSLYYISASPWQLFPLWHDFMNQQGFPDGAFHMKTWSTGNTTFFSLFQKPDVYKHKVISQILRRYPHNRFVFVGDSGELDPEVYGRLATEYPGKVVNIFIRNVSGDSPDNERYKTAFKSIPADRWKLFTHPNELSQFRF